jgi:capsid protein
LSDGNPFGDLSDDDLVETGAALETVLADLTVGWRDVATEVDAEWPKTRKSAIKLGVNTTLALAGVAAAPVTFGLS